MPEIGELVTTTKVFGIETLIQLGATTREQVTLLREELRTAMATIQEQGQRIADAANNIAADLRGINDRLTAAQGGTQEAVNAALAAASAELEGPIASLEAVAAQTPDEEPAPEPTPDEPAPPVEPEPGTPVDPNAPTP